jgi:hypothetical protein
MSDEKPMGQVIQIDEGRIRARITSHGCPPFPDGLGPTQRRDPVSSSSGGLPHQLLAPSTAHYGI